MKRWFDIIFLITILSVWVIYIIHCVTNRIQGIYPMSAIVEEISIANDTVTIRDYNGNLWQFKGVEDWEEGDICACILNGKNTPEIKDDEIIAVRYSGTTKGW